ncbi:hypothetical protein [Cobetia sp. cqz5-12]
MAASTDLNIAKACGMGNCGSGRVRVLSGEVVAVLAKKRSKRAMY